MFVKKKIIFRADGNSNTGLGHLYRLFALVDIYKFHFETKFVTRSSTTCRIIPNDYSIVYIPSNVSIDKEPKWLEENFNTLEHIIIADGYQFNEKYQFDLKSRGFNLIYIDDLVEGYMHADIVINHSPNITSNMYDKSSQTKLALGTDYAILRPPFMKAARAKRKIKKIEDAFVCFGGADTLDLSYLVTKALLDIEQIKSIHVVLGAAYNHTSIFLLNSNKLNLYRNLNAEELSNLMSICNLAIAPSSTILYELCAVKMPVLSGYFVENQKRIYHALLEKGAIYGLGDFRNYSSINFKKEIIKILNSGDVSDITNIQRRLFDGKNTNRFLQLLNELLITIRKVEKEDMMLIFKWSNDPLVRQNSFHPKPIIFEDHKAWFNKKLNDINTLFLIAAYNNQDAGIIRFQTEENHAIISILIGDNFRGKKLSASFLRESVKYYFKKNHLPIFSYIKLGNQASIKAFQKAGFKFYKNEIINHEESVVYKLEKGDVER